MGNKPIGTKSDPLVLVPFKILKSQKSFLDNLGEPASSFIRKLIASQMDTHETEITKLESEAREHEAHLNIIKSQIVELKATIQRKKAASNERAEFIEQIAQRLKRELTHDYRGNWKVTVELQKYIKNNIFDANKKLNGSGECIQEKDVLDRIFQIREAEEAI